MGLLSKAIKAANTSALEAAKAEQRGFSGLPGFGERSALLAPTGDFEFGALADGKVPWGHQSAAIQTILINRRIILGYAPGLGKTLVALGAAALHVRAEGGRVVVVAPLSTVLDPWEREANLQHPDLRVAVLSGTKSAPLPDADIVIVPVSIIAARKDDVLAWAPTALILDEGQYFKNLQAARTKAVLAIADSPFTDIVAVLTGTPAKTSPDDVFALVRILGAKHARALSGRPDFKTFQSTWCETEKVHIGNGRYATKTIGLQRGKDLHAALRRVGLVRVERSECVEMPEKLWATVPVSGDLTRYYAAERDFLAFLSESAANQSAADRAEANRKVESAKRAEAIVKLNGLRRLSGEAKAQASATYIANLVAQGEPVVVMAWHTDVVKEVVRLLNESGVRTGAIVGGISPEVRLKAQDDFRAGIIDVLICNITAAGTGLNLEKANQLVFIETCWSPGDLEQASDRIYRITQRRDCTVHVLILPDTIDVLLWERLQRAAQLTDSVNAGGKAQLINESSIQDGVIADLYARA